MKEKKSRLQKKSIKIYIFVFSVCALAVLVFVRSEETTKKWQLQKSSNKKTCSRRRLITVNVKLKDIEASKSS